MLDRSYSTQWRWLHARSVVQLVGRRPHQLIMQRVHVVSQSRCAQIANGRRGWERVRATTGELDDSDRATVLRATSSAQSNAVPVVGRRRHTKPPTSRTAAPDRPAPRFRSGRSVGRCGPTPASRWHRPSTYSTQRSVGAAAAAVAHAGGRKEATGWRERRGVQTGEEASWTDGWIVDAESDWLHWAADRATDHRRPASSSSSSDWLRLDWFSGGPLGS